MTVPKPGATKQYEEAWKKHNEFHKAEKDKTPIWVWSISAGPGNWQLLTATCGQTWKEMDGNDSFDQRDEAVRQNTLTPTVVMNESGYYVFRSDLSTAAEGAPTKMMTAVDYFVRSILAGHRLESGLGTLKCAPERPLSGITEVRASRDS